MEMCTSDFYKTYQWLNSSDSSEEFTRNIYNLFSSLGFKSVGFGGLGAYSLRIPKVNNFDETYLDIYIENNFYDHDHVIDHCRQYNSPMSWRETYPLQSLSKKSREIINVSEDFDITFGIAIPLMGSRGKGLASLNFDGTGVEQDRFLKENMFHIMGVCQAIFWALTSYHSDILYDDPSLTPKELECLKLLSSGLGNLEIANLMSISINRVKELVKFILNKLQVANRTEAVMHAFRSGIIH